MKNFIIFVLIFGYYEAGRFSYISINLNPKRGRNITVLCLS